MSLPYHHNRPRLPASFRLSKIVTAVGATITFMGFQPVYAADEPSLSELQAEIARLKQALEKSQQELAAQKTGQPPASTEPQAPQAQQVAQEQVEQEEEQAELGRIVVRSRNKLEALQDVPISISVVSGQELDRFQARDLGSITQRLGNIAWNQGNARTSSISIRGLGQQAQTDAMDPSVGVTVDDISFGYNPLSSFDFYDVEAVEVARGPQGTLRGKNASIGALTITSRRPTFESQQSYALTLGDNNRVIGNAAIGGTVVEDVLAWRGAFMVDKGEGWYPNDYNRDFRFMNKDNVSGRVQFLLTPTENFNALVKLELTPKHEEYYNGWTFKTPTPSTYSDGTATRLNTDPSTRLARDYFLRRGDFNYGDWLEKGVNMDNQRPLVTSTWGTSAVLNWNIGDFTLTSITGYKNFSFQARNDEGTPFDISKNGGGLVNRHDQLSQEFRLSSSIEGLVDYQAGLYYTTWRNDYSSNVGFGSDAGAWFANPNQYGRLYASSAGRELMQDSLSGLEHDTAQDIHTKSTAVYGQANWHVSEPLTVTTGLRLTLEDRSNSSGKNIKNQGFGSELNPYEVNGIALGGFNSTTSGTLFEEDVINGIPDQMAFADASHIGYVNLADPAQAALANATAQRYFGVDYGQLTGSQAQLIADAKSIRQSNLGIVYNKTKAETFRKLQPTLLLSPSYRFHDNLTGYLTLQYGEKAGVAQVVNGFDNQVKPEKTISYEAGIKSVLLDNTLTFNANLFLTDIKDYQQRVLIEDAYTTQRNDDGQQYYTEATGNAAKVRSYGVEIDGFYTGIQHTTLRFAGAYNNAKYRDFKNSALPPEINNQLPQYSAAQGGSPFRDVSGENLPGASKFSLNLGADFHYPVFSNAELHSSLNVAYRSRFNSDVTLSDYGWVDAHTRVDFAIGLGRRDRKFDVTLLVKNLFDNDTSLTRTWNTYVPAIPRWIGVMFTSDL
ncbi:TonB-dependent receptor [Methylobacillus arboreus]|uniref:TonB-dependent receptor n=1 Tax=Methylobacillus arboreus TaxID=755170 RepID=UPI001E2E1032|nr:TonB-dependent receptor [Methylobacillus arboreus]MCB5189144.1 TonB-dependent receptor [Methylobacillus arboreus]